MLSKFIKRLKKGGSTNKIQPVIIPRNEHTISRQDIHPNALKVLYRLHNAGFGAYLVGGCVRDLLLGFIPKDFDIATNAKPEEVRRLFRNCRLIGKRFRLAHIVFGKHIIEVATFRTHHTNAKELHGKTHEGMIIRDNVYGDIEDDVLRRDFSINALYYNIADFSVVDYIDGMSDIKTKTLRMIGNPEERFQEDPVRLLRAARFLGKLNLTIDPETEKYLIQCNHFLEKVSSARLFQEVLKFFQEGATQATFQIFKKYNLIGILFPQTNQSLEQPETQKLIEEALINTDQRFKESKTISPAFLLAAFLWRPTYHLMQDMQKKGFSPYVALEKALQIIFQSQTEQLAIPRHLLTSVREICILQYQLTRRHGARPYRLLEHARFRAAYDLLLLRAEAGEPLKDLANWWTMFYSAGEAEREQLIREVAKTQPKKRSHKKISKKREV